MSHLTAIRLLRTQDPAHDLLEIVQELAVGKYSPIAYSIHPRSFRKIANSPFAYWVSEHVRSLFDNLLPLEGDRLNVRVGLQSSDDFRFIRVFWETPTFAINTEKAPWLPFAKGGSYSPFYGIVDLRFNWGSDGEEVKAWAESLYDYAHHWSRRIQNPDFYFRPGLTWPPRTQSGLGFRALPKGCIIGHKGPAVFEKVDDRQFLSGLLALTTSEAFRGLVEIQMAFGSYEVGVLQRTVIPELDQHSSEALGALARSAWKLKQKTDTNNVSSPAFFAPALSPRKMIESDSSRRTPTHI
jgi:hypothetical protein